MVVYDYARSGEVEGSVVCEGTIRRSAKRNGPGRTMIGVLYPVLSVFAMTGEDEV